MIKYNNQSFNHNIPLINSPRPLFYIPTIKNKTAQKSTINKKEIIQIKKDINQKKINNLLNKKRISETEIKINKDDVIKNNNLIINKMTSLFVIEKKEPSQLTPKKITKKYMFSIYKKSKYIFRKRKPKIKKIQDMSSIKINCGHEGCEVVFKTKKHLIFHHYKISSECHNDTIILLKMISFVKKLLLKENKNNDELDKNKILEKYSLLYEETMKNISLDEHIDTIVGFYLKY